MFPGQSKGCGCYLAPISDYHVSYCLWRHPVHFEYQPRSTHVRGRVCCRSVAMVFARTIRSLSIIRHYLKTFFPCTVHEQNVAELYTAFALDSENITTVYRTFLIPSVEYVQTILLWTVNSGDRLNICFLLQMFIFQIMLLWMDLQK